MSSFLESEKDIKIEILKKPLFSLYNDRVIIKSKEGEEVLHLNQITDLRLKKERNLSINIIFLFFTVLLYAITSDYYNRNFIFYFGSYVLTIAATIVSLSAEHYTYGLYIRTRNLGFKKLSLSKKD